MTVNDGNGKIIRPGTPGRKYVRKLDPERVKIANQNAAVPGFIIKYQHPRRLRFPKESMALTPWGRMLQAWRNKKRLLAKEAAALIGVPFDTYRGWLAGKHSPTKIVMDAVMQRMKNLEQAQVAAKEPKLIVPA